jgi:hypothetical protein
MDYDFYRKLTRNRVTVEQEASYYLDQYMATINNGDMEEWRQQELANYYLGLYYMVLEELYD